MKSRILSASDVEQERVRSKRFLKTAAINANGYCKGK